MGHKSSKEVQGKPVVLVVGAGYAGVNFAKALDKTGNWNVVLIERKDHFVHNIAAPRAAVKPGFEAEILIPYTNLLQYGSVVQGEVIQITPEGVSINGHPEPLRFDHLVIATGSSYAFPGKLAETNVPSAVAKYKACQEAVARAKKIVIVGGGPVGVEMAGELVNVAKEQGGKTITLTHSGGVLVQQPGLLPEYSSRLLKTLQELGVNVLLNERVILEESKEAHLQALKEQAIKKEDYDEAKRLKQELDELHDKMEKVQINIRDELPVNYLEGPRTLKTVSGKEIEADLIFFCMGMKVNNASLAAFESVMTRGRLNVDKHLRVQGTKNIYAVGDICSLEHPMAFYGQLQAAYLVGYFEKTLKGGKDSKPHQPFGPASICSMGPRNGACQLPLGKGVVLGNKVATMIKSKELLAPAQWDLLNQNRKTKEFKEGGGRPLTLAAALQLSEEEARRIAKEGLPELTERAKPDHS